MNSSFLLNHENSVTFQGPAGELEAVTLTPAELKTKTIVVLCHPNPQFGGTMNNKVITTLARSFRDLGYRTLRFNFRGTGKSAGTFDHGVGETDDVLAIFQQLREAEPDVPILLAGFSFGSYVAYRVSQQFELHSLITLAPPSDRYEFSEPYPKCPWTIIIPEQDEIVPPDAMIQWSEALPIPIATWRFPNTGHFFHGHLLELKEKILQEFVPK